MAIAMDSVWDETAEALKGMADPEALLATVTAAASMYLLLWALPEPVSKGVAATLTAIAIAYLGVDTVWRLLDGWLTLVREVDRATTFEQLREAGEAYGEVLGENAARIFVMLATAAIGNTAGLAAMTAEGFTVALAPNAVAMSTSKTRGTGSATITWPRTRTVSPPREVTLGRRGSGRSSRRPEWS